MIRLNLSRAAASSPAGTLTYLQNYLYSVIRLWRRRSGRSLGTDPTAATASPAELLTTLVEDLADIYEPEPVVLVDKYDAPIVNHIGTDRSLEPAVVELREFIRVLKDDEGLLYGVFVTGITRFARRHLFAAANNFIDISDRPAYRALCGFTEDEVDRDLAPYRARLAEREPGLDDAAIRAAWRDLYNGYRFSELPSTQRVYNPFTLTNGVFREHAEPDRRRAAADGQMPSAWSKSGHPGLIARLAADPRQVLTEAVGRMPPPSPGPKADLFPTASTTGLSPDSYGMCDPNIKQAVCRASLYR